MLPYLRLPALLTVLMAASLSAADAAITAFTPGVVSYTYRDALKANVPGTLDMIKALGIHDIEFSNLFGKSPEELRALLDARSMTCSSFGVNWDELRNHTDVVAKQAKTLGARFIRIAWLPNRQPFTLALAHQTAQEFNTIGQLLRERYGLTFCYHNHGYEFVRFGDGTLFDVLVRETDPANVSYELDILWAFMAGVDPAALLAQHGARFQLMHLKDLKKGVIGDLSGRTAPDNDVALGTGQIDIPAVLRAGQRAGIAHIYVEDESSHTDTQIPQSLRYLDSLCREPGQHP